jgi:hypothetical protein
VDWKVFVDTAKGGNEVVFPGADGAFGGIATMYVGRHELKLDIFRHHVFLECPGAFVIESL